MRRWSGTADLGSIRPGWLCPLDALKIYSFKPFGKPNFGDVLNEWLWPRLVPGVFDEDDSTLFMAIGTYLNIALPNPPRLVIFGTGAGYGPAPEVRDSWAVYCVRGPLSARALGLPPEAAVTDGAALIRRLVRPEHRKLCRFSYMPHLMQARAGGEVLRGVCEKVGIRYIDPCAPVEEVLAAILGSEVLLAEAMHGAIVADALRVPWQAVRSTGQVYAFKWRDWCLSLDLRYRPRYLLPLGGPYPPGFGPSSGLRHAAAWLARERLGGVLAMVGWRDRLGRQLERLASTARPVLSSDQALERRTCQLEERLEAFRRDVAAGRFAPDATAGAAERGATV